MNNFEDFSSDLIIQSGQSLSEYIRFNNDFINQEFFRKKSNRFEKLLVSSSSFKFGEEFCLLIILQNITEIINKHESNISQKYHNLILFSVSHEIRSNLNIITGSLEQIIKKFEIKLIIIAKYAAKIMETKLNLLMDFVQIFSGKFNEHRIKSTLRTIIDEITDIIKVFAEEKKIIVKQKYKNPFDEEIECDFERIFSIIIHIALNSVKFSSKGSIVIRALVYNGFFYVSIKDTGSGMSPSLVNKICHFSTTEIIDIQESYNNSWNTCKENQFLTGLGLTSSLMICKALGGLLNIKSIRDVGTKVFIKIPCIKLSDLINGIQDDSCIIDSNRTPLIQNYSKYNTDLKKQYNNQIENCLTTNQPKSLMILIVDDHPFNRKVLKGMLESMQLNVIFEAENGLESIKICEEKSQTYDQITIFMDIEMPIMYGIEATRILKANDKQNKIKIIMLSAFNSQDVITSCFKAGAIDFCVKPISFKKLKEYKNENYLLFDNN